MRVESAAEAAKISGYREALTELLFQLADDELVMGHRDSEWLGLAPDIEEDVAFSSIAQDEVGHSVYFFERLHELGETDSDRLAFGRGANRRRNAVGAGTSQRRLGLYDRPPLFLRRVRSDPIGSAFDLRIRSAWPMG